MSNWQARFQERRAQFLVRALDKMLSVVELIEHLKIRPSDEDTLIQINKQFHQFAGAGGIYELAEFCHLCIAAEEICTSLLSDTRLPSPLELDKLMSIAEAVRTELNAAGSHSTPSNPLPAANSIERNIIIVTENSGIVSLQKCLEKQDWIVRKVKSASAMAGACLVRQPDAVLIDANLTNSSAAEVVTRLRSMPSGCRPLAVAFGENTGFEKKVETISAGANVFLEMPMIVEEMVERIDSLLRQSRDNNGKILSLEDDPEHAEFIKSTLEAAGYSVRHVFDCAEFEEALLSYVPDLVLLDIMLLGKSTGIDVAKFVRQQEKYASIPIIFLTSQNQLDVHLETARAGGDEHLVKPVPPALLVAAVSGRLDRKSATDS